MQYAALFSKYSDFNLIMLTLFSKYYDINLKQQIKSTNIF